MKLRELAERLDCRLEGDGEVDIRRVAGIEHAEAGDLTFVANPKYHQHLSTTQASAIILSDQAPAEGMRASVLRSANPYLAFAKAVGLLTHSTPPVRGRDPLSAVSATATLGAEVSIGAFAVIGDGAVIGARTIVFPNAVIGPGAIVGDDCVVHAHVSVREGVRVGHRVIVQDGAVIGSDGFGFVRQPDGSHFKIPQHGDVVVEDDVEIGANTTIDRPAVGETRIGAGTKIDNLVHVAHGVAVGRRVLLAAQVGIAGSTTVEDDVMMAGQTGVTGHVRVGKGAIIGAKSAVLQSVDEGAFVTGHPAIPHNAWRKASMLFRRLPAFRKRVDAVEQRLAEIEEKLAAWQRSRTDR